jgi:hypothetical protein
MKRQESDLFKISATAANPKEDFNHGDKTETKTKP